MDKLKIASWNVRGLESLDRKYAVKRFLRGIKDVDILVLQEIKAIGFNLKITLKFIWKNVASYFTKHPKGKGGTAILVGPKWRKKIDKWGNSPCNRASWITFKFDNFEFGLCSIYAPNEHLDRIKLWQWIAYLPSIPWIISRDFNMIERPQDKSRGAKFE